SSSVRVCDIRVSFSWMAAERLDFFWWFDPEPDSRTRHTAFRQRPYRPRRARHNSFLHRVSVRKELLAFSSDRAHVVWIKNLTAHVFNDTRRSTRAAMAQ